MDIWAIVERIGLPRMQQEKTIVYGDLVKEIEARLTRAGLPIEISSSTANEAVTAYSGTDGSRFSRKLILKSRRLVIKSDDLQAWESLWKGLEAAGAAGLFTSQAAVIAAAAVVVGIFRVAHRIATKAALLNSEDIMLLLALKSEPSGLSAREIAARVGLTSLREISQDEVER